jgi:hypothetical protein
MRGLVRPAEPRLARIERRTDLAVLVPRSLAGRDRKPVGVAMLGAVTVIGCVVMIGIVPVVVVVMVMIVVVVLVEIVRIRGVRRAAVVVRVLAAAVMVDDERYLRRGCREQVRGAGERDRLPQPLRPAARSPVGCQQVKPHAASLGHSRAGFKHREVVGDLGPAWFLGDVDVAQWSLVELGVEAAESQPHLLRRCGCPFEQRRSAAPAEHASVAGRRLVLTEQLFALQDAEPGRIHRGVGGELGAGRLAALNAVTTRHQGERTLRLVANATAQTASVQHHWPP